MSSKHQNAIFLVIVLFACNLAGLWAAEVDAPNVHELSAIKNKLETMLSAEYQPSAASSSSHSNVHNNHMSRAVMESSAEQREDTSAAAAAAAASGEYDANANANVDSTANNIEWLLQLIKATDEKELNRFGKEIKVPSMERYRKILSGMLRKNSLYNTIPIDAELFDKYMNDYVYNAKKRINELSPKAKKAACGNLNGNPMHKWICW